MCENDDDDDGIFYEAQPAMVENGFINGNTYTYLLTLPQTPTDSIDTNLPTIPIWKGSRFPINLI